jgi:hypothetical protein
MTSGSPPALAIEMKDNYYNLLNKERNKPSCSRKKYRRLSILLLASEGQANKQVARSLVMTVDTVKYWRNRWIDCYSKLLIFEKGLAEIEQASIRDKKMVSKLLEVISDRPRAGKPPRISLAQKQEIIALACKSPSDFGIEQTDWTYGLLAKVAMEKKIVDSISPTYLGRLLKNKPTSTT